MNGCNTVTRQESEAVRLCTQPVSGKPCPNRSAGGVIGWCHEHIAEYWTLYNNLRAENEAFKASKVKR